MHVKGPDACERRRLTEPFRASSVAWLPVRSPSRSDPDQGEGGVACWEARSYGTYPSHSKGVYVSARVRVRRWSKRLSALSLLLIRSTPKPFSGNTIE
jgi:hypothetical protein